MKSFQVFLYLQLEVIYVVEIILSNQNIFLVRDVAFLILRQNVKYRIC